MPRIPQLSGKAVIEKFLRLGYNVSRQKGSHARLIHHDPEKRKLTIPLHNTLKKGLLSQLIKDAGVTLQEFIDL